MANSKKLKDDRAKSSNIDIDIKKDIELKEQKDADKKQLNALEQDISSLEEKAQSLLDIEKQLREDLEDNKKALKENLETKHENASLNEVKDTESSTQTKNFDKTQDSNMDIQKTKQENLDLNTRLKDVTTPIKEHKAQVIEVKEKSHQGLIIASLLIIVAAFSFISYDFFNKINNLTIELSNTKSLKNDLVNAQNKMQENVSLIEDLKHENQTLMSINSHLVESNKELNNKIDNLTKIQDDTLDTSKVIIDRLNKYEDRNPYAWKIAEAYFMVKQAFEKATIGNDVKSALWFLKQADSLLVNIQDKDILQLRRAVNEDIVTLSSIQDIDKTGIAYQIEANFKNIDNLVFKGFMLEKSEVTPSISKTDSASDWKENLLTSVNDFSKSFIEIRRRDGGELDEFLTPQQELFIRENIKTRLTLALSNLANLQSEDFTDNINAAKSIIETYFESDNKMTKATVEALDALSKVSIKAQVPDTLKSHTLFEKIYKNREIQ